MEYTKGEWVISESTLPKGHIVNICIKGTDPIIEIASIHLYMGITTKETMANAYLCASSPKMYEALKYASENLEASAENQSVIMAIDAALAAAECKDGA
jgi:hypothetical protein